ncbi:Protein OS-9, partial [Podila epigama]
NNILVARTLHSTVIMTKPDGSRWSCRVPSTPAHAPPTPQKSHQEIEREEQQYIRRGLELLDHLPGKCLISTFRSWTYEFCYGDYIRQFYESDSDEHRRPRQGAPVYILGRFKSPTSDSTDFKRTHKDPSLKPWMIMDMSTAFETSHDRNYLVQNWRHGDICDMTNHPRSIRFQCARISEDRIHSVTEPSICTYIIVISSPRLCSDPAFRVVRPAAPEAIQCTPLAVDTNVQVHAAADTTTDDSLDVSRKRTQSTIDHSRTLSLGPIATGNIPWPMMTDDDAHRQQLKHGLDSGSDSSPGSSSDPTLYSNSNSNPEALKPILFDVHGSTLPTQDNTPLEGSSSTSRTKSSVGSDLSVEAWDDQISDKLLSLVSEMQMENVLDTDRDDIHEISLSEYSEQIKESIKHGGRILIHPMPQEDLLDAIEDAKELLEREADEEEYRMSLEEDEYNYE